MTFLIVLATVTAALVVWNPGTLCLLVPVWLIVFAFIGGGGFA